jgi:hypothetical protein
MMTAPKKRPNLSAGPVVHVRPWEPWGSFTLPMPAPAPLGPLLAAVFGPAPSKRPVMLRPRPPYLPHPLRRLARLPGVVRARQ